LAQTHPNNLFPSYPFPTLSCIFSSPASNCDRFRFPRDRQASFSFYLEFSLEGRTLQHLSGSTLSDSPPHPTPLPILPSFSERDAVGCKTYPPIVLIFFSSLSSLVQCKSSSFPPFNTRKQPFDPGGSFPIFPLFFFSPAVGVREKVSFPPVFLPCFCLMYVPHPPLSLPEPLFSDGAVVFPWAGNLFSLLHSVLNAKVLSTPLFSFFLLALYQAAPPLTAGWRFSPFFMPAQTVRPVDG